MISRRAFVKTAGLGAAALGLGPLVYRWRHTVDVVILRPVAGGVYSNAAKKHFAHKIYPSEDAARQRLPYYGLKYEVAARRLPVPPGVTAGALFEGRLDLDIRVDSDRRHMGMLKISEKEVARLLPS